MKCPQCNLAMNIKSSDLPHIDALWEIQPDGTPWESLLKVVLVCSSCLLSLIVYHNVGVYRSEHETL